MAAVDDRALWKAIAARAFASAYCLFGEEEFLKDRAVRELVGAAIDPATRDFNLDIRDGGALDAETLGALLATPPMMAERRMVVIRDAGALRKPVRAVLDRHLARLRRPDAQSDVLLVLVLAGDKGKPDRALLERTFAVEMAPLRGDRLPRWIAHHASELGARITPEAADLLTHAVGSDLGALAAELDKLASYVQGETIDEAAVSATVGVRRGETLGDFLDHVARRDAPRALEVLAHVLGQPKTTAVTVVMALTTQTLALGWGAAMRARGVSAARLPREYFDFLRSAGGAYTGRPWGEAASAWARVVDGWSAAQVDAALAALLETDIALKETRVSGDEQLLATLVLRICAAPAAAARGMQTVPRRRAAAV